MTNLNSKNGRFLVKHDGRVKDFDTLHDALIYIDYVYFLRSCKKALSK